jgi:type I restriction enzyme, S subunit
MQSYPLYKDSGVEWIGKIPTDWEMRKISHSFDLISSGTTPKAGNKQYYNNGKINWINTGDLNNGLLKNCKKQITTKAMDDYSALKIYPKGALIIAMYGATIGKVSISDIEACTNQACCVILSSKIIDLKFIFFWFIANKQNIISLSFGGGQPNISQNLIREIKICCPELVNQQEIASYLDHKTHLIDTLIKKKQRLIDLLKEERTAVINEAVTKGIDPDVPMKDSGIEWLCEIPVHWNVQQLRFACEINYGITLQLDQNKKDGMKIISVRNITFGGEFNFDSEFYIDESLVDDDNILKHGDILFNWRNGSARHVGKTAFFDLNGVYTHVSFLLRIRVSKNFDPFFMKSYLSALRYRDFFVASKDKVNKTFNSSELNRLHTVIPPKSEQVQIVKFINTETSRIGTIITKASKEIDLLKEYRTALISEVVTGKIDVRDWEKPKNDSNTY